MAGYVVGEDCMLSFHEEACVLLQAAGQVTRTWVRPQDRLAFDRLLHQAVLGQVARGQPELATALDDQQQAVLQQLLALPVSTLCGLSAAAAAAATAHCGQLVHTIARLGVACRGVTCGNIF